MKQFLIIMVAIFFLSLLETTLLPVNLTLVAVIVWTALVSADLGLLTAFLAGLIFDFLSGQILGTSSIIFLLVALPVIFYKNRFQADRWQFLLPFVIVSAIIYNLVFGLLTWWTIVVDGVLVIIFLPILRLIAPEEESNKLKL